MDVAKVNISARVVPLEDLQELDCEEVVDDLYLTMFRDVEETVTNEGNERFHFLTITKFKIIYFKFFFRQRTYLHSYKLCC